ncbi:NGFI-A-binding protein 1-like isoform X2 [Xenia sp. Carnegie-2017]|uniref:NGFI-A-binding protein 1-like isoform X2 n=1 Tax=Xenia sp. Carnegie-2017 TaxID=2897299 RepID=UPI001F040A09|nr:NGFI-A-binding protein 1-like isoform X2 [Xenia sp. Carnegie-2017]
MNEQNTQKPTAVSTFYSLLERAKLADYYERFLAQGGDDIDQLCEATDDEFKEITRMVGMHTKPLHIRRLQKALLEFWAEKEKSCQVFPSSANLGPSWIEIWNKEQASQTIKSHNSNISLPTTATIRITTIDNDMEEDKPGDGTLPTKRGRPPKGVKRGAQADVFELKLPAMDVIINWEKLDEERKQLIREHSRIYGRDTKKRKSLELNSHEQVINEAAAQLCLRDPTLLVRRDELFSQARRIVRDSGFPVVHGHSRSKFVEEGGLLEEDYKFDSSKYNRTTLTRMNRQARLEEVNDLLVKLLERQVMLIKKRRELEINKQPIGDLQQELNNLSIEMTNLQIEQKQLQKKLRRSERYQQGKVQKKLNVSMETPQTIQSKLSGENLQSQAQHAVIVTDLLQAVNNDGQQHDQGSSGNTAGGQTLYTIIPQQQLADATELDQTTINSLLNIAQDQEKLNTNPPGSLFDFVMNYNQHSEPCNNGEHTDSVGTQQKPNVITATDLTNEIHNYCRTQYEATTKTVSTTNMSTRD